MTVENDLRRKWRMPTELDGHMPPIPIHDVKTVVVHKGHRFLPFPMVMGIHLPYRGLGTSHQEEKHPLADFGFLQVFLGHPVFVFSRPAIHHWNPVGSRIAPQATTESPCQSYQMRFVQSLSASR
jgi:hypothetical protein